MRKQIERYGADPFDTAAAIYPTADRAIYLKYTDVVPHCVRTMFILSLRRLH